VSADPRGDAELLDTAADVIIAHGWHRGGFWPPDVYPWTPGTPVCLVGALYVTLGAVRVDGRYRPRLSPLLGAVRAQLARDGAATDVLAYWNDHQHRTADDVIDLLRRSAKALREAERGAQS
jgi:hypothetical protein